jgi:hypothetical protein
MLKFNDIENVKVYKIADGIILYKNVFNNTDDILSFFKEAELYKEDRYMMKKFYDWGQYGVMTEVDSSSFHDFIPGYFNENEPEEVKQKAVFEKLNDAYKFVKKDFMLKYGNKNIWPSHYNKIDLFNEGKNTKIAFLKYETDMVKVIKGEQFEFNFTAFHSDYFEQDMDTPGYKLIFTTMMYLNDDYEGGEICFWSGDKMLGYKPEPGDIVVFPSCEPFYHGVLNIYKNNRYAIRMNYCAVTEGSKEFKDGTFKPSLNYTNHKVGYSWIKNGKETITNPELHKNNRIDPPIMLTIDQMERVLIDAKD